ncbi:phosphatase 2C-like domain-containing protein [Podospora appendiculata]|uniref:Protein phosphatase n=1 Tax=Podospora appendiculata TaxID=314037 RepID=A0AAE1CGW1_9PEZI|nr:phosphatase 2C-like domain-containing protein [Podospora appendiculata]
MRRLPPRLLASTPHARLRRGTAPSRVSSPSPFPSSSSSLSLSLSVFLSSSDPTVPRPGAPGQRLAAWRRQMSLLQLQQQQRPRQRASVLTALTPLLLNASSHAHFRPLGKDGSKASSSTVITPPPSIFDPAALPKLPFRFDTGIGLFAKRAPRPFPPPFLSPPSGSFSDPLSTHNRSRDRRAAYVGGQVIQGLTNGDDAVFASEYFICANDGVGAWSARPKGHAGLWSRLILHFWATAIFEDAARQGDSYKPDPVAYLQRAYEQTLEATSAPNDWQGTTTAAGAQLHYRRLSEDGGSISTPSAAAAAANGEVEPLLYVTNLGDSQIMVVRPSTREVVFKSTEQWHWFDCPRQLGTNSPDTPVTRAVVDEVPIREGDVVLAMSDGVIDNLWSHEIVESVSHSLEKWRAGEVKDHGIRGADHGQEGGEGDGSMAYVAGELMEAAKTIALDPFAESPFMEHAIEEGLASEGGKLDDISVVAGLCRKNN